MIFLRRALAALLGLFLLVLLLVALVLLQVSDMFLSSDYYVKELRKADIYEFVLVDLVASALDEARDLDQESLPDFLDENPLVATGLSNEEIVSAVNRAVPPEWVQGIVEQVLQEAGKYLTTERDSFEVTIKAGDQVRPIVSETKALLRKADAYNLMFEELVTPAVDEAVTTKLPFGLNVPSERLVTSARRIVPPEWVQAQVEAALDEVTPYVTGESDTFEVRVELLDRAQAALDEATTLLHELDAGDLLYDEVIQPALEDEVGAAFDLPVGIEVTRGEVLSTLRQGAPPDWIREQAEIVTERAGQYVTGRTESLSIAIPLRDNKRAARDAIVERATAKVRQAMAGLGTCTAEQALLQVINASVIPDCLPPGIDTDTLVRGFQAGLADTVDSAVLQRIPDEIRFTDQLLRQTLTQAGAVDNIELVDDVRELIHDGWTYTEADLREDLRARFTDPADGDNAVKTLDNIRAFLADGWSYTNADLREQIARLDGNALDDFDTARDYLSTARAFRLLVYLPVLILLGGIGLLGGRSWSGRFAWAAAFLLMASGIIFLASGPGYELFGEPRLHDASETAISEIDASNRFYDTERLATTKLFEMLTSVANGFAWGVAIKSLILFFIGSVVLVAALRWADVRSLFRRKRPAAGGADGPPYPDGE